MIDYHIECRGEVYPLDKNQRLASRGDAEGGNGMQEVNNEQIVPLDENEVPSWMSMSMSTNAPAGGQPGLLFYTLLRTRVIIDPSKPPIMHVVSQLLTG
jgi:hypothetical protein